MPKILHELLVDTIINDLSLIRVRILEIGNGCWVEVGRMKVL